MPHNEIEYTKFEPVTIKENTQRYLLYDTTMNGQKTRSAASMKHLYREEGVRNRGYSHGARGTPKVSQVFCSITHPLPQARRHLKVST